MTKEVEGMKGEGMAFQSPTPRSWHTTTAMWASRQRSKSCRRKEKYAQFGGKLFETTVGRLLFNTVFPSDYPFINYSNRQEGISPLVDDLIAATASRSPGDPRPHQELRLPLCDAVGHHLVARRHPHPERKARIVDAAQKKSDEVVKHWQDGLLSEEERYRMNIEIWHAAKSEVEKLMPATLPQNGPVLDMLKSGARGSVAQVTQMAGMKGLIASPTGEAIEFPITKSMKEGLSPIEYFITTHGSRKGLSDTALNTAKAGYLTRRLFDVAQDVVIGEEDCGTKEGLTINASLHRASAPSWHKTSKAATWRRCRARWKAYKKGHFITTLTQSDRRAG
jgi:DNA-directed RNA polymerase subunit beta'